MPERPLIIFPVPTQVDKPSGRGFSLPQIPPNSERQQIRIDEQFGTVRQTFVSDEAGDIERMLVMETSARINELKNAIQKIHGIEWQAEIDVEDLDPRGLYDEESNIKGGRFYLFSSNKEAVENLEKRWREYVRLGTLPHGFGKLADVFKYLVDLRFWGVRDRLQESGLLEAWQEEYEDKQNPGASMAFEIQLHYNSNEAKRTNAKEKVAQEISDISGRVGKEVCIEEIAFHAIKAEIPVNAVQPLADRGWTVEGNIDGLSKFFKNDHVFYFRPVGQHIGNEQDPADATYDDELSSIENNLPVLALLDGSPILRHQLLNNRIMFNDPDNYDEGYSPGQHRHGTAMASLICHGDFSQHPNNSLTRKIYVRPVMKPQVPGYTTGLLSKECIPSKEFQEDIIERAVREMFSGDIQHKTGIKVINISIGNTDQQYLNTMSPWARLLDWLSYKYQVLFVVSAGNYVGSLVLNNDSDQKTGILSAIDVNQRNHRLLSPAESMNALTVGALQSDFCGKLSDTSQHLDPMNNRNLPAPYSRVGPGYRGSIKPDIFAPGGRLLYSLDPQQSKRLVPCRENEAPGVRVAFPGSNPENLKHTAYQSGTSHAAALVTHEAGRIFEMLEELRAEHDAMTPKFDAVLIKALLVHSASHGDNKSSYEHLKQRINAQNFKRYLSRFLGYGSIEADRVMRCLKNRATAIGFGEISAGQRHLFSFPTIPSSSLQESFIQLTITLAWFTPINPKHIGHRRARLSFESEELKSDRGHQRLDSDYQQVRKGTVQHEIFNLNKNKFPQHDFEIYVDCVADAGGLDEAVPYSLIVTLEVAEGETVDLYQEIQEKIQLKIPASA